MIVVVAREADAEASRLAGRWKDLGAVLMTPADLSTAGWRVSFPGAGPRFVAAGEVLASEQLRGVLVRLDVVRSVDLPHLEDRDRAYAAAEMTAFLSYWLTALSCPVVNRPSPSFLLGPAWSPEEWLTVAARLGIPVVDVACEPDGAERARPLEWVTVVADRPFGRVGGDGTEAAVALARESGTSLLGAGFTSESPNPRLAAVTVRPAIRGADVEGALLTRLDGARA